MSFEEREDVPQRLPKTIGGCDGQGLGRFRRDRRRRSEEGKEQAQKKELEGRRGWLHDHVSLFPNGEMRLIDLKEILILDVDPVFDEIATEPRKTFKWEPIRRAPAASIGDIRIVDDQTIIIRAVETVVDGCAEFFD